MMEAEGRSLNSMYLGSKRVRREPVAQGRTLVVSAFSTYFRAPVLETFPLLVIPHNADTLHECSHDKPL
jgi:hypothetical protein